MSNGPGDTSTDTLLGAFKGQRPPAEPWFTDAIANAPERSRFAVEGAQIELLTWGQRGKPGLLFLHGNAAHADWWSFIAPLFAEDYRCAAISWSGMGGSDWREEYRIPLFAGEALSAIEVACLAESGEPPVIVAHSFGGFPSLYIASEHPEAIGGAILIDSASATHGKKGPPPKLVNRSRDHRVYPELAEALTRFRFMPEQASGDRAIIDWIARGSLKHFEQKEGATGWSWRFDPRFWQKFDRNAIMSDDLSPKVPLGIIYGADSALFPKGVDQDVIDGYPDCRFVTEIADAHHHIMADQPLVLVEEIRKGLEKLR
ncbi:alpha/beta fold hydrolase [Altererythrobacter sp. MF3-039]|uniref:alpha/beta fold hydrolase n=1 Tax=Altererythrobacter sp. MF3-039 TaxID=3252901 RepID=UPI00390C4A73